MPTVRRTRSGIRPGCIKRTWIWNRPVGVAALYHRITPGWTNRVSASALNRLNYPLPDYTRVVLLNKAIASAVARVDRPQ